MRYSKPPEKSIRKLTNKELLSNYDSPSNYYRDERTSNKMKLYTAELQRRDNRSANRIMIFCTAAITIMTAAILWATMVGANIFCYGG